MSVGIAGIYSKIYSSLAANQSLFPALPEITIRLRSTLNDPSCDIHSAAKLLQSDPGLSAFILRIANSVRYMSRVPPQDLEGALRRIGLASAIRLATTFAIRSAFDTKNSALKRILILSYSRSTKVSVISFFLAQRVGGFDASKVMLAGLLQDIALPPILQHLVERPEIFRKSELLARAIDQLAPMVGVLILKNWGFDKDLIDVVRSRKDWMRDPRESADMADIVLIARLHALIGTPEFKECPPLDQIPAFHKLPFDELTPDNSIKILEESREELNDIARMLNGG